MIHTGPLETLLARVEVLEERLAQQETELLCLRERVKALEGRRGTLDVPTTITGQVPGDGLSHPTDTRGVLRSIWRHLIDNPSVPKTPPDTDSIWRRLTGQVPSTRTAP